MRPLCVVASLCAIWLACVRQASAEAARLEITLTNGPAIVLRWQPVSLTRPPLALFPSYQVEASGNLIQWSHIGARLPGGLVDPGPQQRIIPLTNQTAFFRLAAVAEARGLDLRQFEFGGADLHGAVFASANLAGVNFQSSDLSGVDFRGANLTGANLTDAHLQDALLDGANLSDTVLDSYTGDFVLTQIFGPPAEAVSLCIPNIDFNARAGDYSTNAPALPGLRRSHNTLSVVFRQATPVAQANAALARVNARIVSGIRGGLGAGPGVVVIRVSAANHAQLTPILAQLKNEPIVQSVVADMLGSLQILPLAQNPALVQAPSWDWSVPHLAGNWGLDAMRCPQLWNLNGLIEKGGEPPVSVGIIDGGLCLNHFDMAGAALSSCPATLAALLDGDDHGTAVAGIIGGVFNNASGIEGVSPFVTVTCRVPTLLSDFSQRAAVRELALARVKVINISIGNGEGDESSDPDFQEEVNEEGDQWAAALESIRVEAPLPMIVVAAGNEGSACQARFASGVANAGLRGLAGNVIVVGSLQQADAENRIVVRDDESCLGVDVSAPGRGLTLAQCGGGFKEDAHGTSFAAPYVTGLIAYLLALDGALTQAEIKDLLVRNGRAVAQFSPLIDGWATALDLDRLRGNTTVLRALLDVDDGTPDGNQRVNPADHTDFFEPDADGNGGEGDGVIDISDFRRWRDWFLTGNPPSGGAALDGSADHPKRDLNGDGRLGDFDGTFSGLVDPNGIIEEHEREANQYPRGDFNGDGRLDLTTRSHVPGFLAHAGPNGNGNLTDLEVLMTLFNDDHYEASELGGLINSGDIHVFGQNLFNNPTVTTLFSRILSRANGTVIRDRLHTRTEPDFIYTLPVIAQGYTVQVEARNAMGQPVCPILEKNFMPRPGEDFYWFPICPGSDSQPPSIQFTEARSSGDNSLRLVFTATDNIEVESVNVREGTTTLGQATRAASNLWLFNTPADLSRPALRVFSGEAVDTSGNRTQSLPRGVITTHPDYFVPLDASGQPQEGRSVTASAAGALHPFIFRPGGRARPGFAPDFFLRFPDGAALRDMGGQPALEFSRVTAGFDLQSPFSFSEPVERAGGAPKQIGLGALSFANLTDIFNLNPAEGLPLVLFNRFPIRWRGGAIDDRGLPGAEFFPAIGDLPLPGWSQALPGLLIEFVRERSLRIPFSGEFSLPDGSANSPRVRVASGSPLWLTLRADGYMSLNGPVELGWSNGQNVRAELTLDDPKYCLALEASGLRVQAASNLVDLLPNNPAVCVPASATPAQLAQATRCLDGFARAYSHFSAVIAASASNAPLSGAEPLTGLNAVGAALEAWGFSATAGVAQNLPLDAIAQLVAQLGHQSAAAPELPEVLENRLALMRARRAVQAGAFNGSASAHADLDVALAEAEAAAIDRARNPDAVLNLASMKRAARLLVDIEAERQLAGLPPGQLLNELPRLFQSFADRLADSFDVAAEVFVPDANPAINNLNRFAASETLRDIIDLQANAQLLGVSVANTRLDELAGQIGVRLLRTVNAALDAAESGADLPAFVLAAQDFLELARWAQEALFPSVTELAPLASGTARVALGHRINSLAQLELDRPFGQKTLGRQAHEIRALLAVLRQMPGTVTFAAAPFRRAFDKLEEQLNVAVGSVALGAVTNTLPLLELLEAGTLHRELGARFGFPPPVNWESNRLPQVVARFNQLTTTQRGWRELDQAVRLLINAADRAGLADDQSLRRTYLVQSAGLLATSRAVARSLLLDASGLLRVLDFVLPGNIFIDRPAGVICYNRVMREVSGQFRGALRLPKFGFSLEILNAFVSSGGSFSLDAFGALDFPQPNPTGSAVIPRARPLRLSYSAEDGLRLASDAELTFDNGMFFRGSIRLDDPIYEFGLEAGGLQFNLAKALGCQQPAQLPPAQAPEDALSNLNTFHGAMAESLTTAAGSTASEPNTAPVTKESDPELPPPDVTAWKHFILLHANDTNPPDIRPSLEPLLSLLEAETDGLVDASESLELTPASSTGLLAPAGNPPLPRTLQVDAGATFSFNETGPAHQDGIVPPAQTTWNVVNGDRDSGLLFADGSPASGISLDFGRSVSDGTPMNWSLGVSPVHRTDQFEGPFGPLQNELMSDAVTTFGQSDAGPRGKVGVRVLGLPPAYYEVYALAAPFLPGSRFRVEVGRGTGEAFQLRAFESGLPPGLEALSGYAPGLTHVNAGVTVRDAGDAVVVIVSPTNDTSIPLLNGFQIVAPLPRIISFTATASQIQQGESPQLAWQTAYADEVTVDPGTIIVAASGSLAVRPAQTTTYTLTARNANGVVTAVVTIQVNGAGRNTAGVIRKLNRVTAMTKEAIDAVKAMTRAQLRDQVDPAAFARLRNVFQRQNQILEQILDDPAASSNPETARQVAKSMVNVSANSLVSGFEGIVNHDKIRIFYERALDEFEGSLGFDRQTGGIDLTVVRSKSADESFQTVKQLLDVAADAATLSSERVYNEELIKAYLIGARDDLLDLMQFDRNTGQALLDGLTNEQLREAAEGLTKVEEAKGVFGDDIGAPPSALQQLADELHQRALAVLNGGRILSFNERLAVVRDLRNGNTLLGHIQQATRHAEVIVAQTALLLSESARTAGPARRLTAEEIEVMTLAAAFLNNPEAEAAYQQRLEKALRGFNLVVATPLLPERITQGTVLVNELGILNQLVRALAAAGKQPTAGTDLLPPRLAQKLTAQFKALAREKKAGKQLKEFNDAMLELVKQLDPAAGIQGGQLLPAVGPDPMRAELLSQVRLSLATSAEITTALCGRLGQAPADLSLPDVVVERVFGSVLYNRETGFLGGRFGGSVNFPGLETRFAIREAALANDGSFSIDAAMASPAPLGRARLQTSLAVAGTPAGVATFSGAGTVSVPNGNQGDRVFGVRLGYSQPDKRLRFDAQGNNLDLRLSDDFVLFGAGFGFDISTATPQGLFRANGSAGMFARAKPLPAVVGPADFHLSADTLTTVFSYSSNAFAVSLSNGTIRLPDFFHNGICPTNPSQPATGAQLALVPTAPITVTIGTGENPTASFQGALDFRNFGFSVPGLTNLAIEVCSTRLLFRAGALPCFSNLNATLTIPLPNQTAVVDVTGVEWCVDGFPTAGAIALRQGLRLFDAGGLAFDFQTNSAFGFTSAIEGVGQRTTVFTLAGGLRGTFASGLLFDPQSNSAFSFGTSGSFRWETDAFPTFALDGVTFGGRMRLGGQNGFELLGVDANGIPDPANTNSLASITLTGLTNVFQLSPQRTFEVSLSGAMGSAQFLFFGLGNARFVFDGAPPEPQFTVQSLGFREGESLKLLGQDLLPFRITAGSITFLQTNRPLDQLFAPENLRFTFSGVVDISLGKPDPNSPVPRLFGAVDNVVVSLPGGFSQPPQFSVNTFALTLENLTIGDLAGLSGGLAVGGLSGPPEDMFFAGTVGGGYNGVSIKAIVATKLTGLLGLCLGVNAGPAGIPLDGGTLGGILLTGAEGGVSFLNEFADPCDFKSFLGLSDDGTPGGGSGLRAARYARGAACLALEGIDLGGAGTPPEAPRSTKSVATFGRFRAVGWRFGYAGPRFRRGGCRCRCSLPHRGLPAGDIEPALPAPSLRRGRAVDGKLRRHLPRARHLQIHVPFA